MPPRKTSGPSRGKAVKVGDNTAFARKKPEEADKQGRSFQSELAVDIIGELYPLLLENCTDADDEIDTQAVFETLAGLMGLFTADYEQSYGQEKAMAAFQDLVELALETYRDRLTENEA